MKISTLEMNGKIPLIFFSFTREQLIKCSRRSDKESASVRPPLHAENRSLAPLKIVISLLGRRPHSLAPFHSSKIASARSLIADV